MKTLMSLCKVNAFHLCNPKDPKLKQKIILTVLVVAVAGSYLFAYCFFAARILHQAGLLEILPSAVFTLASIMALISSVYHVNGRLLHLKDDDLLYALPLSKKTILLSRLLPIYLENFIIMAAVFIPCIIAMIYYGLTSVSFYLRLLFLLPWAPMLPLGLGIIIGLFIDQIATHFKHSRLIAILLTFAFVFILYYYIFKLDSVENPASVIELFSKLLAQLYPLSQYFGQFLMQKDGLALVTYVMVQLASFSVMILFMSTMRTTKKAPIQHHVHLKIQQHSILKTLYLKEWRRYFNSVVYVTNTAIAYVLLLGMSLFLQFQDLDDLLIILEMTDLKDIFVAILPLIISFFMAIGTTTAASISMEGNTFWQTKVLPIPPQTIFLAKILLNLSLSIPSIFISCVLLAIPLNLSLQEFVLLMIIPILHTLLFSQVGIICNLYMPNLHWTSETKAVKQNPALVVLLCFALVICFTPILLIWKNVSKTLVFSSLIIFLILTNILCVLYLQKYGPQKYHQIK